ncbi:hypothetical protein [Loktanella salsilacus]|uniref:hypothetical protein n=1 Tax=Loktanella salsilacus TaxID=195913 RepID=UPI0030036F3E
MTELSSEKHTPDNEQVEVTSAVSTAPRLSVTTGDPEFIAALGIVVSAFVDIGFGISAADLALRAANDNRDLITIASEFHGKRS